MRFKVTAQLKLRTGEIVPVTPIIDAINLRDAEINASTLIEQKYRYRIDKTVAWIRIISFEEIHEPVIITIRSKLWKVTAYAKQLEEGQHEADIQKLVFFIDAEFEQEAHEVVISHLQHQYPVVNWKIFTTEATEIL